MAVNENCNMCRKDIYYCGNNTNLYKYIKDMKKRTSYRHRFMRMPNSPLHSATKYMTAEVNNVRIKNADCSITFIYSHVATYFV